MPTLEWIGKDKVVNHHQEVPYRVLERQYSYDETGQHAEDNGSENMIIHGDNLEALKALLPRYEGKVKCIYIDPPYNTGNEGWVYNDNVNDPKIKKWLGEVVGKEGEDLSRHDKWLCIPSAVGCGFWRAGAGVLQGTGPHGAELHPICCNRTAFFVCPQL